MKLKKTMAFLLSSCLALSGSACAAPQKDVELRKNLEQSPYLKKMTSIFIKQMFYKDAAIKTKYPEVIRCVFLLSDNPVYIDERLKLVIANSNEAELEVTKQFNTYLYTDAGQKLLQGFDLTLLQYENEQHGQPEKNEVLKAQVRAIGGQDKIKEPANYKNMIGFLNKVATTDALDMSNRHLAKLPDPQCADMKLVF